MDLSELLIQIAAGFISLYFGGSAAMKVSDRVKAGRALHEPPPTPPQLSASSPGTTGPIAIDSRLDDKIHDGLRQVEDLHEWLQLKDPEGRYRWDTTAARSGIQELRSESNSLLLGQASLSQALQEARSELRKLRDEVIRDGK
ncbi:MAG: hypothetical protein GY926_19650 [bacterium]|nr:hypothetical protein [bacterium]